MTASRLNLLGGFDLDCGGGKPMAGAPRKVKALLAYLALEPDTPHPREKLATLLWEASGEQQGRQSLRQALADLRKVLPGENTLISSSEAVTLAHDAMEVDAVELARLSGSNNAESLEQAVALYRGELLEGFNARAPAFDDWLALERNRIREQGLTAMASLLEHSLARGTSDRAISLALRILALDPLREPTHRALMQLYAKQGRYGSALKQYEICRSVLARELGVAPEQETTTLFRDLAESRKHSPRSGDACASLLPFEKGAMGEVSSESGAALPQSSTAENPLDPSKRHSELRQVTVLAVVIAEFAVTTSRLEPDELRECLNRYYGIADGETKRYGGVITKHADDSVISVFGLPAAESSDTERAVRAAAAIQRGIAALRASATPPLRIRIGIASGKVMTDEVGSAHYRERSIIGRCVTLAEDLAQTAAPDEIVIADEAYQGVAARFSGSQLLASALSTSVSGGAWRLGVERLVAERSFVGRQRERSAFASALEACRTTQCGQAFLVRGDAGIGKSRLLEEFEAIAKSDGFAVHKALVLDFGISFGQDAIRALVKSLLQLSLASPPDELRAAAERAVAVGLVEPALRGFLDDLLGLPLAAQFRTAYEAMGEPAREEGKRSTVARLVESAAAQQPTLIAVEDIHWADTATLSHLAHIAQTVARCASLLVMSARSDSEPFDPAWRGAMYGAPLTTLDLAPLREEEATELARSLSERDDDFVRDCVKRAGGNPFFLEQLLRSADGGHDFVPHSVQSIVCAYLYRLDDEDKQAARAAAVMGQRFSLAALRHLLGDRPYSCDRLLARHLVRPWGDQYLFTHALIADAIYGSLLKSERKRLHRVAADWFSERDARLAAEHLDRAGDPGAAFAYLKAARIQARAYHNDDALRLARRGHELAHDAGTQYELARLEGGLAQELGAIDASIAAYKQASQTAVSGNERCRAWLGIAAGLRVRDRYAEALDYLERAERVATRAEELALIHFHRGNIMVPLGRTDDCLKAHDLALEYGRQAASPMLEARALSGLGDAHYLLGRMRTACSHFGRCIDLCRTHGFGRIEVANLAMRGATRFYASDVSAAIEDARAAADLAIRHGNRRAEAIARNISGYLLYYAAEYEAARAEAEQGIALALSLGSKRFEVKSLLNLGMALFGLSQPEAAEKALDEAYAIGERSRIELWSAWVLGALALVTRNPERRGWALAQGETVLAKGGVGHSYLHFYQLATEAALAKRDWGEAERYAGLLDEYTRAERLPWSDFFVARARALARYGRNPKSKTHREQLKRCADEARRTGLKDALPEFEHACRQAGEAKRRLASKSPSPRPRGAH